MVRIGLIRETKIPVDNRVALVPSQCKWLQKNFPSLKIFAQPSADRCYSNKEYEMAGVEMLEDLSGMRLSVSALKKWIQYNLYLVRNIFSFPIPGRCNLITGICFAPSCKKK